MGREISSTSHTTSPFLLLSAYCLLLTIKGGATRIAATNSVEGICQQPAIMHDRDANIPGIGVPLMLEANDNPKPDHAPRLFSAGNTLPFILVTALFLLWGIPNNLNDVLIKQFMKSFEMTRLKAGFIQSAFYMGYFLLSMPAALLMRKYGYKAGLVTGLFLYSAAGMERRKYPM